MWSVWLIQLIRHHLNQPAWWQGTQSLVKKSHSQHSLPMSPALMHCGNLLTIQFQTQTTTVYTVPQLLSSPHHFTFIRPHTSIKGRTEQSCSFISCLNVPLRSREVEEESRDWVQRERGRQNSDEGEGLRASTCITFWGEFSPSGKAENDHFAWEHVHVQAEVQKISAARGHFCTWVCVHSKHCSDHPVHGQMVGLISGT